VRLVQSSSRRHHPVSTSGEAPNIARAEVEMRSGASLCGDIGHQRSVTQPPLDHRGIVDPDQLSRIPHHDPPWGNVSQDEGQSTDPCVVSHV